MIRRRSLRLAFRKKTEEAKTIAATFLGEHGKLRQHETPSGMLYVGHIGPKAAYPERLRLEGNLEWLLKLCKDNMEELYDAVWGWDDRKKLEQFQLEQSHVFVVFEDEALSRPIGFCQVVLEWYDRRSVLYIYELQIMEEWRRKGIGKWLMAIIETLGNELEAKSLVLTCMKENAAGKQFYRKHGFAVDPSSPDSKMALKYEIMSKGLVLAKRERIQTIECKPNKLQHS